MGLIVGPSGSGKTTILSQRFGYKPDRCACTAARGAASRGVGFQGGRAYTEMGSTGVAERKGSWNGVCLQRPLDAPDLHVP